MPDKKRKGLVLWLSLLSFLVLISLSVNIYLLCSAQGAHTDDCYTLFVGTNDGDTNQPEMPFEEALRKAEAICEAYLDGATFETAWGLWTDENGIPVREQTIEIILSHVDAETVHTVADALLRELHQDSILIVKSPAETEYYESRGQLP